MKIRRYISKNKSKKKIRRNLKQRNLKTRKFKPHYKKKTLKQIKGGKKTLWEVNSQGIWNKNPKYENQYQRLANGREKVDDNNKNTFYAQLNRSPTNSDGSYQNVSSSLKRNKRPLPSPLRPPPLPPSRKK